MASQLSALLPSDLNIRSLDTKTASTAAFATLGTIVALSTAWVVRD